MLETDWLTWLFWAGSTQGLRDLGLIAVALVGLPFLVWRTIATHRQANAALQQARTALQQAETASRRHEQQTEADRQRRITESFARAIEQLGSDTLEVRVGGIHALARIARESPADHWPIMETLTAFVTEKAALPYPNQEQVQEIKEKEQMAQGWVPSDVQAALTAIGHRCCDHDHERNHLDLCGTNLSGANLENAHLENANLSNTFLMGALLAGAHLDNARLSGAHLEGAILESAQLTQAWLDEARLDGANLKGAVLDTVFLREATLSNTCLVDSDLRGAVGLTQDQLNEAYGDPATTKLPEGMIIPSYRP